MSPSVPAACTSASAPTSPEWRSPPSWNKSRPACVTSRWSTNRNGATPPSSAVRPAYPSPFAPVSRPPLEHSLQNCCQPATELHLISDDDYFLVGRSGRHGEG